MRTIFQLFIISLLYSLTLSQQPNNCIKVAIKNGDTCYNLWTQHGMTEQSFKQANPSLNCQNLQIGQSICIIPDAILPGQYGDDPTSSSCRKLYSIKAGDTCSIIWNSNQLTEATFLASNPGINCNNLQVGQHVCLNGQLQNINNVKLYDSSANQQYNSSQPHLSQILYQPLSQQQQSQTPQSQQYQNPQYQTSQIQYQPQSQQYQPSQAQQYQPSQSQQYQPSQAQQYQPSQAQQYQPSQSKQYQPSQAQQYQPSQSQQYQPSQAQQYQPSQSQQYQPSQAQQYQPSQSQQYQPVQSQQYQTTQQQQYQPSQAQQYQPAQAQQYQPSQAQQYQPSQAQQYQPSQAQQYQPSQAQQYQPSQAQQYQQGSQTLQYQPSQAQQYPPSQAQQYQPSQPQLSQPSQYQGSNQYSSNIFYDSSSDQNVNQTCRTHSIRKGDTCFDIWSANGMTQESFTKLNPHINCQALQLGQQVCTDPNTLRPGQFRDDASCRKLYSIKAGDTCSRLWQSNGISEQQFMMKNPGVNCNNLQIGQDICLA